MTRSDTSRANPISWVTTNMVMPSDASCRMTSSTSPTSSGSRADVASSNIMIWGFIASARAMATRCCCPPERREGNSSFLSKMPTLSRRASPVATASSRDCLRTTSGASMTLPNTVLWGQRLKSWKTMPISARMRLILACESLTSCPSGSSLSPMSWPSI